MTKTLREYVSSHTAPQRLDRRGDETLIWFGDNNHTEWRSHFDLYVPPPFRTSDADVAYSFGVGGPHSGGAASRARTGLERDDRRSQAMVALPAQAQTEVPPQRHVPGVGAGAQAPLQEGDEGRVVEVGDDDGLGSRAREIPNANGTNSRGTREAAGRNGDVGVYHRGG